jgi:hypothetical protein
MDGEGRELLRVCQYVGIIGVEQAMRNVQCSVSVVELHALVSEKARTMND